jgi:SEC-C motif
MTGPYTQDKIENWVSDFCVSDAMREFSPGVRDAAGSFLVTFLAGACDVRGIEPEDVEEADLRMVLAGPVARLGIPKGVRGEVPAVCGALLAYLEAEGRLSGGRMLGAFVGALRGAYLEAASGKRAPIVRPGSKLGRNDPCPCGSGKKYKKCCLRE